MLEYFLITVFAIIFIYAIIQIIKGNTGSCGGKACENCKYSGNCNRDKKQK